MIHVIATIEIAPGKRADFLREFHAVMPQVHAEDGCIEYGPTVDVPTGLARQIPQRPDMAVIVEKWRDVDALKAHLQSAHMAVYRERVKDLVKSATLQVLEPA